MTSNLEQTRTEKLLLEAARQFNTTLEYEELIELVLRLVMKAVSAEAAIVFRIDHKRTNMRIRFLKSGDDTVRVFERELGQGVIGWVAQYRKPIIINDPSNDPRVDPELARMGGSDIHTLISVPLIGRGEMIGVIEAINKENGSFSSSDLDILTGLNDQIAVAIANTHLYREANREATERKALYEVGKKLSSSLTLDELLHEIMVGLQSVLAYDSGGIFLVEPETGEVKSINTVGYDPANIDALHVKIGQGVMGHVAKTGEAEIVPDVSKDDRYISVDSGTKSEIVVPVKLNDQIYGVLNLESKSINAYDHHSLALMEAFASQVAISLDRARLHESLLEGKKLEEQINIARQIQKSFLPKKNPEIKGYDIAGSNIPSGQVGGDYYDFIRIVDGHLGVAIADVSGKGMPAALIMASFRASLIAEIRNNYAIRTICGKVNRLMCESLEPGNYVTGVYGVLDFKNHILTFSNCGHNLPILFRASGEIEYLKEGGPVLGVTPEPEYEERAVVINAGDICMLYTDGVTEAFDPRGEAYGMDRLIDKVRENKDLKAEELQEVVLADVHQFAAEDHLFDDLTMVIIMRDAEK